MSERFSSTAKGAGAFEPRPRPDVPKDVQVSFVLWLAAVAAGVFETVLAVMEELSPGGSIAGTGLVLGVGIRLIIFAAAVYVASQMRLGKNWARLTLAIGLGVIGILSLMISPVSWLAEGHSVAKFLTDAGLMTLLFTTSRVVHVAAVLTALVFMFLPAANNYFRAIVRLPALPSA